MDTECDSADAVSTLDRENKCRRQSQNLVFAAKRRNYRRRVFPARSGYTNQCQPGRAQERLPKQSGLFSVALFREGTLSRPVGSSLSRITDAAGKSKVPKRIYRRVRGVRREMQVKD